MMPNTADIAAQAGSLHAALSELVPVFEHAMKTPGYGQDESSREEGEDKLDRALDAIAKYEARILAAIEPQAVAEELWALCYLHDWDPPREGQEHRWEPGKNVFPEVHAFYHSWQEADAIRSYMSTPEKYWVVRARPESAARLAAASPVTASDERAVEALLGAIDEIKALVVASNKDSRLAKSNLNSAAHRLNDLRAALAAAPKAQPVQGIASDNAAGALTVGMLAKEIRRVRGHSLGAGALAEALLPFISALSHPVQGWQTMDSALRKAVEFIEASSGEALGIAMSGSNHPNPDEVLMARFRAASSLIPELRGALAAAPLPAGPFSEETAK